MTDRPDRFGWNETDLDLEDDPDESEFEWTYEELAKAFDDAEHPRNQGGMFVYDGGREADKDDDDDDEAGDEDEPRKVKAVPGMTGGGSYRRLRAIAKKGEEVHHMPANEASHLHMLNGPAIIMPEEDHIQTASYGTRSSAAEYRRKQRALINAGKWEEAQQMDIDDIRKVFGDKYDAQIEEMLKYDRSLKRSKRDGRPRNPTKGMVRRGKA